MLPSTYVFLDVLPLTPNGKIDRKALPSPAANLPPTGRYAPPRTDCERALASVWCEVLNVERVGVHDNFFDIGGHSLLAIESIVKFKKRTGYSLDPRHFYQQTLGQLAASVDGAREAAISVASGPIDLDLEPFFFGSDERRLYGLIRLTKNLRDVGIVLCQPHAHEYLRCHRAFRELGQRLAWEGFPVLSFDYYGTGDSGGEYEDGTISGWVNDTGLAIDTLKQRFGIERICLVGLRLGATIALMTGARRQDVTGIALWDPVVAGADIERDIKEIRDFQALDMTRQRDMNMPDVLCYALTSGMMSELQQVDLFALPLVRVPAMFVLEAEPEGSGRRFANRVGALGASAEYRCSDEAKIWLREPYEAIVPRNNMEALVSWVSGLLA